MKTIRDIAGYVLGGILFVALLPAIMWLASGMPDMAVHIGAWRAAGTGLLIILGLSLSIYTIVYMKTRGKGNPMDAFGKVSFLVYPPISVILIAGDFPVRDLTASVSLLPEAVTC